MKYLKISNSGLIEIEALSLVGASTKRGDNSQIGMFGSGNKYAISYLLRNGIAPEIYSGMEKISIETKQHSLRDENFDVMYINGEKTSITTQMGHHWKLWMAIREIYANAIDEGVVDFCEVDALIPKEGETHFYIPMNDHVSDMMFNIDDYFSKDKKVLFECEHGKILKKHSSKSCIYRKGILCYESNYESIFDYDLPNVPINEDRMVNYEWYIWEEMYKVFFRCDNTAIIRSLLNEGMGDRMIESNISSVSTLSTTYINDAWDEVLEGKDICPKNMGGYVKDSEKPKTFFLASKLYNALIKVLKKDKTPPSFKRDSRAGFYTLIEDDENLVNKMIPAIDFFADVKFKIPYKIKFANFIDSDVYGCADNDTILLSPKNIDKGIHFTINTIIEEYIHLKTGAGDETRAFQDAAINVLITYMKTQHNIKL